MVIVVVVGLAAVSLAAEVEGWYVVGSVEVDCAVVDLEKVG